MPLIAVGAAIFAGSSIAAAGGLAAFAASSGVFAAIGAVGAIAAGIGAITGNKTLMKVGAIAGLVGGVGAFATSQGWLSAGSAGIDKAGLAGDYVNQMDIASDAASATQSAIAQAAPGIVDPSANLVGAATTAAEGATAVTGAPSLAGDAASAGIAAETGKGLMNSQLSPLVGTDVGSLGKVASVNASVVRDTATSKSIFDSMKGVGEFMNKNKDLTSMGMKFVQGMFDDKAEKAQEAQNAYMGARTSGELLNQEQLRQQMANMNAVPDLTGLRINPAVRIFNPGAPPVYSAPRAGLINSTGR